MEIKHINKWHENLLNQKLLEIHSINGGFRDESDFLTAKYHSFHSLMLAKQIIEMDGTNEEKLEFIEKAKEDLEKFTVNNE